jgi:hypothetical protein
MGQLRRDCDPGDALRDKEPFRAPGAGSRSRDAEQTKLRDRQLVLGGEFAQHRLNAP